MKKFILMFSIGILFGLSASAQLKDTVESKVFTGNENLKAGTVISEKAFRKFAGTWVYSNNETQLILELKISFTATTQMIYSFETLSGGYKLEKNGKTIIDALATSSIYAQADRSNENKIILNISDNRVSFPKS
ncbi:MAG: DUF6705 family protein [Pedobacter sp.]